MKILRTPDACFENLADYPFEPHYTVIKAHDNSDIRIHHIDEGPEDGPIILCMHGQPVWSYLYRKMIPYLTKAGMRVIAPDLVGYGKSDKPAAREDYSYERQVEWMGAWLEANKLKGLTLFGQDWGGLIGLRLVASQPNRFDRVTISNTGLPYNPDVPVEIVQQVEDFLANASTPSLLEVQKEVGTISESAHPATKFAYWQKYCWEKTNLPIGLMTSLMMEPSSNVVRGAKVLLHLAGFNSPFPTPLARAYDAPFPDPSYKMGPRAMPCHVPTLSNSPSLAQQAKAWEFFETFKKPFLCAFADDDPVTAGLEEEFLTRVPGTKGLPHTRIKSGGHFVQESAPEQVSRVLVDLIRST